MLTHHSGRVLLQAGDLVPGPPPVHAEHADALRTILDWARQYLTKPHRDLGRSGPVCPFVSASLRNARFHLAVCPGADLDRADVVKTVRAYRNWFGELSIRDTPKAQFTTILILFPELPAGRIAELIDGIQAELKLEFVHDGLMLGQFHPLPPSAPGLWNPDFRPLHSPVPMLVIRHMVASDLPFLTEDPDHAAAYDAIFGARAANA